MVAPQQVNTLCFERSTPSQIGHSFLTSDFNSLFSAFPLLFDYLFSTNRKQAHCQACSRPSLASCVYCQCSPVSESLKPSPVDSFFFFVTLTCGSGKNHTHCSLKSCVYTWALASQRPPVHAVCLYERLSDDVIEITHMIWPQELWPQETVLYFAERLAAVGST